MNIFLPETNKIFNIADKNIELMEKRSFALKIHLARNKFDLYKFLNGRGIEQLATCNFCNTINPLFHIETVLINKSIEITGINYKTSANYKATKYYCFGANPKCNGKKLNRNSVEFVKVVNNVSVAEAISIIHNRNKTPFYKENHKTEEKYREYQTRDRTWYENNGKNYDEHIENYKFLFSDESFKQRFGDDWEIAKNKQNLSKAITLENLEKRYGKEEAITRYNDWKNKCVQTLENSIRLYGEKEGLKHRLDLLVAQSNFKNDILSYSDFIDFAFYKLSKNSFFKLSYFKCIPYLKRFNVIIYGCKYYNKTFKMLYTDMKTRYPLINSLYCKQHYKTKYNNYIMFTQTGKMLRSKLEYDFYCKLLEIGYTDNNLKIDKNYPNSSYRYDFYLSDIGIYIEIAGYMNKEYYRNKMKNRKEQFNAWIVEQNKFDIIISQIDAIRKGN
jgi:hypothetical protein